MKKQGLIFLVFTFIFLFVDSPWASVSPPKKEQNLGEKFSSTLNPKQLEDLKKECLSLKQKAVPVLLTVMRENKYPEQSRWLATFLVGQIMGKKAIPFLSKYTKHPEWYMRLASLKSLLALGHKDEPFYKNLLKDESMIVRHQVLANISYLNLRTLAPSVANMLHDEKNYKGNAGKLKRTAIVGSIIRTLGDLKFTPIEKYLRKMILKKNYKDLVFDIDYGLQKITNQNSPHGPVERKIAFWSSCSPKLAMNSKSPSARCASL